MTSGTRTPDRRLPDSTQHLQDIYLLRMLHEARRLARYEPRHRAVTTIPHGTSQIERMESVELQDGRIYQLSTR